MSKLFSSLESKPSSLAACLKFLLVATSAFILPKNLLQKHKIEAKDSNLRAEKPMSHLYYLKPWHGFSPDTLQNQLLMEYPHSQCQFCRTKCRPANKSVIGYLRKMVTHPGHIWEKQRWISTEVYSNKWVGIIQINADGPCAIVLIAEIHG